ncbi:MAG: glycogen-binding domain-containing protein [Spirochaetes bacterium]|nr:glycogen-binding domain-containing protein [Spirochaetota bacterium]
MKKRYYLLLFVVFTLTFTLPLWAKKAVKSKLDPVKLKKSLPVKEIDAGVLFTYKDANAEKVALTGDFNNWDAGKQMMTKNEHGVWYMVIPLKKGKIEYKFVVNGANWIKDPDNKLSVPDPYGGENSVFTVKKEYDLGGAKLQSDGQVQFKYFAPQAGSVNLAGSFNNWSMDSDPMEKDNTGFWVLKKKLESGSYQYKYVVDGNWTPDPMNSNTTDDGFGGVNSVIEVK